MSVAAPLKRKADEATNDSSPVEKKTKTASITSFFGPPKPVAGAQSASSGKPGAVTSTAKKFDKEAWIAKLTPEQKELLKLEIDTLHDSWLPYLADELTSSSFLELKRFIKKERESGAKIFPPAEDVYSWYVWPYDLRFLHSY